MVSDMQTSRKRKAETSGRNEHEFDENSQMAHMSLAEFMKKGFSSDDDDDTKAQSGARSKAKKEKKLSTEHDRDTLSEESSTKRTTQKTGINGTKKTNGTKTSQAGQGQTKKQGFKVLKRQQATFAASHLSEKSDKHLDESVGLQGTDDDDIEDVESDDEVIAKPRVSVVQADSEDEALDQIELSDIGEDELIDMDTQIVTEKKLRSFLEHLRNKPNTNQIKRLTQMFNGAVCEASGDQNSAKQKYIIKGQRLFNAVVSACLQDLVPVVHKVMKLPPPSVPKDGSKMIDPTKGHLWRKVKNPITLYMADLLKLIGCITHQKLLLSLLRHVLLLLPFVRSRPQIEKRLLKTLSRLWSTGEESVRIVSFLCLIRLIRSGDDITFQEVLKAMYLSYIANSKFTSPQTWPLISFMRRSLVEAYALRPNVAYQHSFLYIRQLAITLRTAMTVKKKDSHKTVYNWQFVHSLLLWCHLLATIRIAAMQPLIYPVVQVSIGVLNLMPTEKYIPLRLHVIRGLIELSTDTQTFVPIMPMLVATLKQIRWNKKPKVASIKPMNLSCALRVSDKQSKESAFRDAVMESFQDMALGYLTGVSHLMSFPEIVIATVVELKRLKLGVVKHQTTLKQLLDKISENSRFINGKREQSGLALKELEKIAAYELQLRGETPLCLYQQKYQKLREERRRAANEDFIENYDSGEDQKNDNKKQSENKKNKNRTKADDENGQVKGIDDEDSEDSEEDKQGNLDPDLDTEEEGDDEIGFEIAEQDDDDED
ncbi:nucleolar complex protein 2 homolog [Varroa jacobsoni]|uniref:nucleolar complex protein 2 homolog n=1 Tax=Varroa jacobsoni TaxID=62625 RepID=UPI000BFA227A|nr:nucleolar complex protein 2 homolog [Varroa jacobsoni]